MVITNSVAGDADEILEVYRLGIEFQKAVFHRYWPGFDVDLLRREISEKRHWKIMLGDAIACVFSVLLEDELVWGRGLEEDSIYLHRIVTNPRFRGNHFVGEIVKWAKEYARQEKRKFIRLDTFPDNQKLNEYYSACGFRFAGLKHFGNHESIPEHYRDGLSLFEMSVD
jgi:RimJ/RimL family protein N-acetyltransferase